MFLKKKTGSSAEVNVKRVFFIILAVYAILVVAYYFLAGDQLRYRESRGNVEMLPAETGSVELCEGAVVEQHFTSRVDRIHTVGVQFGAYYRENFGTLVMELLKESDGAVLLRNEFDVHEIVEGQILELSADTPVENREHERMLLRITADAPAGAGVTPLISTLTVEANNDTASDAIEVKDALICNGIETVGSLCFSVTGEDYIWTGQHYWKFVIGLGFVFALFFFVVWRRYKAGKRSYLISAMFAVKKYRFLIDQLASRDFKVRYKRSILGTFWSFLNPLLMMLVQYYVFSTLFKSDVPNFAAYLIIGLVMFNFFSEATGQTLMSILGNAGLITKVYMPKYIYPLTKTILSLINFAISLVPMIGVCLLTGVEFHKSAVLALYFCVCLVIFTLGMGMLLATSMVFFRDTQFLWSVFSLMWMYATPVFYPERIIPENLSFLLKVNPLYYFIKNVRICILDGVSPEPMQFFICAMFALGMLLFGSFVFIRQQNKFILYL